MKYCVSVCLIISIISSCKNNNKEIETLNNQLKMSNDFIVEKNNNYIKSIEYKFSPYSKTLLNYSHAEGKLYNIIQSIDSISNAFEKSIGKTNQQENYTLYTKTIYSFDSIFQSKPYFPSSELKTDEYFTKLNTKASVESLRNNVLLYKSMLLEMTVNQIYLVESDYCSFDSKFPLFQKTIDDNLELSIANIDFRENILLEINAITVNGKKYNIPFTQENRLVIATLPLDSVLPKGKYRIEGEAKIMNYNNPSLKLPFQYDYEK